MSHGTLFQSVAWIIKYLHVQILKISTLNTDTFHTFLHAEGNSKVS